MSPQGIGISTTYKTRVATSKPCKERLRILIGQSKDSRRICSLYVSLFCVLLGSSCGPANGRLIG
jgi:hypothetical protein